MRSDDGDGERVEILNADEIALSAAEVRTKILKKMEDNKRSDHAQRP